MDREFPAHLVQHHVMVPVTVILEIREAGVPAVGPVHHVVGFAAGGRLVAAAGDLAPLVPQGHQAAQVEGDVVGLALVRILYLFQKEWTTHHESAKSQFRAASYARLSETYYVAESVPTQLANVGKHAQRRGCRVVARFKDDGYSAGRSGGMTSSS